MEPIPETVEAVEEFGPFAVDLDVLGWLRTSSERVREIVPDCVGLSLAILEHGVCLTLVSSSEEIAAFDALQYVAGGPCVEAAETSQVVNYDHDDDPMQEDRWQLFARGTAAASIASTLSLPIMADGAVKGSVNLYATSAGAFDGHHDAIAAVFDAWAPGAVTNADLSFSTREAARRAPSTLSEDLRVQIAVGLLAHSQDLDTHEADVRLSDGARRAGLTRAQLAEVVIALESPRRAADSSEQPDD